MLEPVPGGPDGRSGNSRRHHAQVHAPRQLFHRGGTGPPSDGGSARRDAATAACESLGGSIESFYFSFGDDDAVVIADLPSNADAAALSLAVAASGMVDARVTVLLTPEEIDTVAATVADTVTYSPPGD